MSRIDEAFRSVNRKNFLPEAVAERWQEDTALPIGYGQTNSQPYTVHTMLEWLDAKRGDKVLDVGSGSGWTSALLAHIVGKTGKIYAVERIPELVEFGRENCERAGVKNIEFFQSGKVFGLPEKAPYDRILVSATSEELPEELLSQLKIGGKLVIPVLDDIQVITRIDETEYERLTHPGFIFVPLIREY